MAPRKDGVKDTEGKTEKEGKKNVVLMGQAVESKLR